MQHGPYKPLLNQNKSPEKIITKSFEQLLKEVFFGKFNDFRAFLAQKQLIKLVLQNKNINDKQLTLLGQALKGTKVTMVDLNNNKIGAGGVKHFGEALKDTEVTWVNLSNNKIGDEGAKYFGRALKGTEVTWVNLSINEIGDEGVKHFGEALKDTKVRTVNFCFNQIGNKGAKHFGEALKNTKVATVNFCFNRIGDEGAKHLGEALKSTKVTKVDLRSNIIGDEGTAALIEIIPDTTLITLRGFTNPELQQALWLNQQKLVVTPFYNASLFHLPKDIKEKHHPLKAGVGVMRTKIGELKFAGGIVMNLPCELVEHVNRFLPLLSHVLKNGKTRAKNYTAFARPLQIDNAPEINVLMSKMKL